MLPQWDTAVTIKSIKFEGNFKMNVEINKGLSIYEQNIRIVILRTFVSFDAQMQVLCVLNNSAILFVVS